MGATSGIGSGAAGPWYRGQAILADGRQGASAERDEASVLPPVLNAAMHRRPFIAGWLSRGGGAPLELITNAGPLPLAGPAGSLGARRREHPAALPPGQARHAGENREHQEDRQDAERREDRRTAADPGGRPAGLADQGDEPDSRPGPPGQAATQELLFPWGARGTRFTDSLLADLDDLVWAPCPGRQAPQLAGELAGYGNGRPGSGWQAGQARQGHAGARAAGGGGGGRGQGATPVGVG